ncbi:hypothetical protein EMIHUDRAFT_100000 [Emiliania huxleyi CCMP1516]|uniref:Uncharacterized protein n=2 Tax=Emiliania huxleyi TaxID=2903 RepID=A0A0D3JYF2_EMIH1|nr:hypothetical protein EMIHUDRAFT_100000 [Emiliania huxleyi CCMP1516]EOD28537.1 hypothetical protein EMIHUDRAFT_100000 [Emiliania huxleyi CCMP1516]|eukprot:XP_005780966.1 hypothetical protein EMIHUDRAFT_100000 [Emiliania huxleyi CCMP1516]
MDAVTKAARRAQIAKDVAAARRDQQGVALSKLEIVEKLNELPAFAIVGADKSFVPLQVQDAAGETTVHDVAVIWTEPQEAQAALAQARAQRPDAAIGTLPLGKAFALCEGWAQAAGASRFRLQAHSKVFPLFLCEELSTDECMPIFLSRAEMVATWEEAMQRSGGRLNPPDKLTVLDLRLLVARMQQGGIQDWSVVKFVGTDRAYAMVEEGQRQETERPPPLE